MLVLAGPCCLSSEMDGEEAIFWRNIILHKLEAASYKLLHGCIRGGAPRNVEPSSPHPCQRITAEKYSRSDMGYLTLIS